MTLWRKRHALYCIFSDELFMRMCMLEHVVEKFDLCSDPLPWPICPPKPGEQDEKKEELTEQWENDVWISIIFIGYFCFTYVPCFYILSYSYRLLHGMPLLFCGRKIYILYNDVQPHEAYNYVNAMATWEIICSGWLCRYFKYMDRYFRVIFQIYSYRCNE